MLDFTRNSSNSSFPCRQFTMNKVRGTTLFLLGLPPRSVHQCTESPLPPQEVSENLKCLTNHSFTRPCAICWTRKKSCLGHQFRSHSHGLVHSVPTLTSYAYAKICDWLSRTLTWPHCACLSGLYFVPHGTLYTTLVVLDSILEKLCLGHVRTEIVLIERGIRKPEKQFGGGKIKPSQ